MTDTKEDYRNSQYCPNLVDVKEKKDSLDALIRKESPRTKIIYNKISSREEKYNKIFAVIEENIKAESGGFGSRCIPENQEQISNKCVHCGKEAKHMVIWGKSY